MTVRPRNRMTKMKVRAQTFDRQEPEQTFVQTDVDDYALEGEQLFGGDDTTARRGLSYGQPPTVPQDPSTFAGRLDAEQVSFTTASGFNRIEHNLRRTPRRYMVISQSGSELLTPSGKAWNESDIYLTAGTGGVDVVLEIA